MPENDELLLSPTQVTMALRCGEQYQWRYIRGLKIPPAVSMAVGSGCDAAASRDLSTKLASGELAEEDLILDLARDTTVSYFDRDEISFDEDERKRGKSAVRDDAVDAVVKLSGLWHGDLAPIIKPQAVQRHWKLRLEDEGESVNLHGYMDYEEADSVRDLKVRRARPPAGALDSDIQMGCYGLSRTVADKRTPRLIWDILLNQKKRKTTSIETCWNRVQYQALARMVLKVARAIKVGLLMPNTTGPFPCSPKWCGYHSRCPWVKGRKIIAMGHQEPV